jgi:hypothetical protein
MILTNTDYISLGSAPSSETCAALCAPNYEEQVAKECKVYISYLKRLFPIPESLNGEVGFKKKSFSHDFGTYYEVCVVYSVDNPKAQKYANKVEGNMPEDWDEQAKEELAA